MISRYREKEREWEERGRDRKEENILGQINKGKVKDNKKVEKIPKERKLAVNGRNRVKVSRVK